ncbi:procyclic acidic repetitive family protein [Naasia aerilata]|uniref:Peptide zinc metalloprotease protein n=1 Tax=Naasia aerilata TaxID=1162966 RepID=A0ABN6XQF6_9MICO|nr:procyclic acidic repetitive family protein [Naasia aerilata]BDZ47217.1 hypothetical protein GCM10025866_31260 [Naasia aerilata]
MTVDAGAPPLASGAPAPDPGSDALVRADGVQLLGEMGGSGYRTPPALVRRGDGQVLQLTPLLYAVLDEIDGRRTPAEVADAVSARLRRAVSADDIGTLVTSKLLPLGLLRLPDGSEPAVKRGDPLLRMRFRIAVTDAERTRRITAPFAALFTPFLAVPVLAAFAVICWWLLFERGLAAATRQAFDRPALLLLVFVITLLSAGFHEFGHAAAATRGGAAPGKMGAGLYLVWPAFYTDVTDSYRLGRWGRIRTDLGGLYFNAIVAVVVVAVWFVSHDEALLLVVASQILLMVRQLTPMVRFDGYHVLADVTGVPDLFQRIGPTLRGLLPWHWKDADTRALKPGARITITAWVLIVVPMLLLSVVLMILGFPRVVGTALASAAKQSAALGHAAGAGDAGGVVVAALAIVAIAIPVAGMAYLLVRLVRQSVRGAWRRTEGRPVQRTLAGLVAVAVIAALGFAWWPSTSTYRPVQSYEAGTVTSAVRSLAPGTGAVAAGETGQQVVLWPGDGPKPTADDPALSLVLLPRTGSAGTASGTAGDTATDSDTGAGAGAGGEASAPAWVFPFDRPAPPKDGSSQALAVNTTDGTVDYDVAFALVWVEDDTVDTTNEAYAFASCTGCAAVAVGFQVVLVVGQADVVVPQNLAEAVNYNCVDCVTYALASQLVLTLSGPLSDATMTDLAALWQELAEFGQNIQNIPLADLQARLDDIKSRIAATIQKDPSAVPAATAPTPMPTPSIAPTPDATPEPEEETPATDADDEPAPEETAPADPEPAEPEPVPSAAPSTEPEPTPSDTPATAPAG